MATLSMSQVREWSPLPIDARDVVTKVRLVITGPPSGWQTEWIATGVIRGGDYEAFAYNALPVEFVYEAPEHATYGCERVFQMHEDFNPFLPSTDAGIPAPAGDGIDDVEAVVDGDPETFATITDTSPGVASIAFDSTDAVGFVLMYSGGIDTAPGLLPPFDVPTVNLVIRSGDAGSDHEVVTAVWPLLKATESVPSHRFAVLPDDARFSGDNDGVGDPEQREASTRLVLPKLEGVEYTNLRVYHFYPLILDVATLEEYARAQVRLPVAAPRRVTFEGTVPPDVEHTVTDWPGGAYTGRVARTEYREGVTVVDFEAPGAPVGSDAIASEQERVRRNQYRRELRSATRRLRG